MTLSLSEILLYAGALFVLFMTPGPVWIAVIARGLSGGYKAVIPLAFGVVIGDVIWPLVAIFGITALTSVYAGFLVILKWLGAGLFLFMGYLLVKHADASITENETLTRPGMWAGFSAGLLAIAANPKAMLFYLGLLPGFFDMARVTNLDVLIICLISAVVPFFGNLSLAAFMEQVRRFLRSPMALRRTNIWAGIAMVGVGIFIAFSG
ncbi:MAG: LysE family translocator [Pseudomonadota bacterium]